MPWACLGSTQRVRGAWGGPSTGWGGVEGAVGSQGTHGWAVRVLLMSSTSAPSLSNTARTPTRWWKLLLNESHQSEQYSKVSVKGGVDGGLLKAVFRSLEGLEKCM